MDRQIELPLQFARSTRLERAESIMAYIEGREVCTMLSIARSQGLKKTPYLRGIMQDLAAAGLVTVRDVQTTRGIPTKVYTPVYGPNGVGAQNNG